MKVCPKSIVRGTGGRQSCGIFGCNLVERERATKREAVVEEILARPKLTEGEKMELERERSRREGEILICKHCRQRKQLPTRRSMLLPGICDSRSQNRSIICRAIQTDRVVSNDTAR